MTTARTRAVVNSGKGKMYTDLKKSRWVWRPKGNYLDHVSKDSGSFMLKKVEYVDPKWISKSVMAWSYLSDYEDYNGVFMAFRSDPRSQVVLRAPRKDDVYILDLKNIVPSRGLENQLNHNVKIIRCDNGTEFKNHAMNEFCAKKGIKREFSVARTPQKNGVAERKNRTLIEVLELWYTPDSYVAGSSEKDKEPSQEYILLPLHPHRTRISVEDVALAAHEKSFKSSLPNDNDVQDSKDFADKEEQHQMTEDEQVLA
ncbi:retrovirus-related pol polyprotein from transposon TNT 1-94 [Tanacetum coccineum]